MLKIPLRFNFAFPCHNITKLHAKNVAKPNPMENAKEKSTTPKQA
jgi:hypothetical protein